MRTDVGSLLLVGLFTLPLGAQNASFHGAPASAKAIKNPYSGNAEAASAGEAIYARSCAACHGNSGAGVGNVPPLAHGPAQQASDGELFWYITQGDIKNGMPPWAQLPEQQRWQVVTYMKSP